MAFGFSVAAMVYATANVSGGHLNPAITIAMMATSNKNLTKGNFYDFFTSDLFIGVFYIISQMIGAILGSALVRGSTPRSGKISQ